MGAGFQPKTRLALREPAMSMISLNPGVAAASKSDMLVVHSRGTLPTECGSYIDFSRTTYITKLISSSFRCVQPGCILKIMQCLVVLCYCYNLCEPVDDVLNTLSNTC